jgi:replication factor A1
VDAFGDPRRRIKMQREIKKICDLKPGDKGFNITVEVKSREDAREVKLKSGQTNMVANAIVKDDTGEIPMTLWGDDAMNIKEGMFIRVENGLVGDWMDRKELTAGKFGKIVQLNE